MATYIELKEDGSVKEKWLLSGSDDRTIKIWNMDTGKLLETLRETLQQNMHKNGVTCLKVNDTEVFTGG